jgi:hypothetical protein
VSTSEVPVTDTLSYAFNTGAVITGVGSGVGVVSGVVSGGRAGAGSVKGVGAGVDSTVTGSAGIDQSTLPNLRNLMNKQYQSYKNITRRLAITYLLNQIL